jgi:hypothetical protein
MDERRCEALWASAQALRAALGLHAVPDQSTRWWCSRHQVKPRLLARSLTETFRLCQRMAPRARARWPWMPQVWRVPRPAPTTSSGRVTATAPRPGCSGRSRCGPLPWCGGGRWPSVGLGGTMWHVARGWHTRGPACRARAGWPMGAMMRRPTTAGGANTWASSAACRRDGTASAGRGHAPCSPPTATGLSPSGRWPAVASRDVHLGRQVPVGRGGHGAARLATGQTDPAARHDRQPVSRWAMGAVVASTVPATLTSCCLRFSTEQS